jgi:hypothetical protein
MTVDFVKFPCGSPPNEALRPLERCSISHVDDGLVKIDDSNSVLSAVLRQALGHFQTSSPLSSRSAAMMS